MMLKLLTVVGARPQFIKAAVVSRAIGEHNKQRPDAPIEEVILHTGQHFDEQMSEVFFREMSIPKPNYHFAFNRLPHGAMTGRMLEQIEKVLMDHKPHALLVYGDTNSTLAGALAASKCHIPIVHVEAGLRSHNMGMPEEVNRILTDRIASLLCCPTPSSVENLVREGFDAFDCTIVLTGDVMYDAAIHYAALEANHSQRAQEVVGQLPQYHLATVHRAENTDDVEALGEIVEALNTLNRHIPVVLPLHPRTRSAIDQYELNLECIVIEPVGYFDMIHLLKGCTYVLTDSGGLQKEAYFFRKPCITLREETEWTELTEHGFNQLAGSDRKRILHASNTFATSKIDWDVELYGDGKAGEKIIAEIVRRFA